MEDFAVSKPKPKLNMDLNEVFPRSLNAEDFASGKKTYTIKEVEMREFDEDNGGKSRRPCFHFEETPHWLVGNKTNTERIMKQVGTSDSDAMKGKKITLKKDRTQFGPKTVDCVRVVEDEEPY